MKQLKGGVIYDILKRNEHTTSIRIIKSPRNTLISKLIVLYQDKDYCIISSMCPEMWKNILYVHGWAAQYDNDVIEVPTHILNALQREDT
jgi:hypothetical protein